MKNRRETAIRLLQQVIGLLQDEDRSNEILLPPRYGVEEYRRKDLCVSDAVSVAAQKVWGGFVWSATPEGYDYWHDVAMRLETIATLAPKKEDDDADA